MLQLSDVRPISDVRHQLEGWRPPYPEDLQNRRRTSDRFRTSDASDVRHMTDVRNEGPREELPTQDTCKARYAVLFQIRTFPPEPEDEAHIGPTATYDEVIYPGFQHDITTLQITRIQHLIQAAYKCMNTIQQRKIHV